MKIYTHQEFIEKLNELGFNIIHGTSFALYVNGVRIPVSKYKSFGYDYGGRYLQIFKRSDQSSFDSEDVDKAVRICANTLTEFIVKESKTPTYFECKAFCEKHFPEPKLTNLVFNFLQKNWRELRESVKPHNPNPEHQ